jgi:hypothetical protein
MMIVSPMKYRSHSRLPAFFIAGSSWILLGLIVFLVDPSALKPFHLAPVWPLTWIAFTWTIWLITKNARKGVLYTSAVVIFLVLRYLKLGHLLNGMLLVGVAVTVDWYLSGKKS